MKVFIDPHSTTFKQLKGRGTQKKNPLSDGGTVGGDKPDRRVDSFVHD